MGASQSVKRDCSGALLRFLSAPQFSPRRVLKAFAPALGGPRVTGSRSRLSQAAASARLLPRERGQGLWREQKWEEGGQSPVLWAGRAEAGPGSRPRRGQVDP